MLFSWCSAQTNLHSPPDFSLRLSSLANNIQLCLIFINKIAVPRSSLADSGFSDRNLLLYENLHKVFIYLLSSAKVEKNQGTRSSYSAQRVKSNDGSLDLPDKFEGGEDRVHK